MKVLIEVEVPEGYEITEVAANNDIAETICDFRVIEPSGEAVAQPAPAAVPDEMFYGQSECSLSGQEDAAYINGWNACRDAVIAMQSEAPAHHDDIAVDRFSAAMKAKLAKKRAEGRGGWEDKTLCSEADLSRMLVDHLPKGDPVDVANFAMMLHQRGERIVVSEAPAQGVPDEHRSNWQANYEKLLYAVARRFPGESRFDTALRYIQQAELAANGACTDGAEKEGGDA